MRIGPILGLVVGIACVVTAGLWWFGGRGPANAEQAVGQVASGVSLPTAGDLPARDNTDKKHVMMAGEQWPIVFEDWEGSTQLIRETIVNDIGLLFGAYTRHEIRSSSGPGQRAFVIGERTFDSVGVVDFSSNEDYAPPPGFAKYFGALIEYPVGIRSLVVPRDLQALYDERTRLLEAHAGSDSALSKFVALVENWSPEEARKHALEAFLPTFPFDDEDLRDFAATFELRPKRLPAIVEYFESEELGGLCVNLLAEVGSAGTVVSEGLLLVLRNGEWRIVL